MENTTTVKVKYKDMLTMEFGQAFSKITNKPLDGRSALLVRNWMNTIEPFRKKMGDDYDAFFLAKYALKDEKGEYVQDEGGRGYKSVEGKDVEIKADQEKFGETEIEIKLIPLTPSIIGDVKLSAREIQHLGGLFTEDNYPQVPQGFEAGSNQGIAVRPGNVTQLRQ